MNTTPLQPIKPGSVKMLVAEDEAVNYMFIEELFIDSGITLIHANDGEEAIQLFKHHSDIRVILMDIKMPKIDGYTAAKKIKEINPNICIIAQTAYALYVEIEKYKNAFDGYVTKPIDRDELFELVNKSAVTT